MEIQEKTSKWKICYLICVTLRVFKVFCYFLEVSYNKTEEKIRIFSAHIMCVMGSIGSD